MGYGLLQYNRPYPEILIRIIIFSITKGFISSMNKRKIIRDLLIALILTIVIRFTLYIEDCNLLVLSATFLILFGIILFIDWCFTKIKSLDKDNFPEE